MDQGRHLQGRQQSIATEAVAGREDVARLLAPQAGAQGLHGGMDVLIADGRALQATTARLPGPLETEVGHHRGHDAVVG